MVGYGPERRSAACSGPAHNGNTAQPLLLTKIEGRELALRDIIERGYYIGFDASYNIKQLLEADYVVQKRSVHDKRSVKVSLTEKGEDSARNSSHSMLRRRNDWRVQKKRRRS